MGKVDLNMNLSKIVRILTGRALSHLWMILASTRFNRGATAETAVY